MGERRKPRIHPKPTESRPRWSRRSRGAALLLGIALWLILILAYAQQAAVIAIYRLVFDGGVLLLWLIAAIGFGLPLLRLFQADDPESRDRFTDLVTAAGLGIGAMSLALLGLGLAGALNQIVAIALVAAGVILALAAASKSRESFASIRTALAAPAGWSWAALATVPFAAVMTAGAMLPPYLLWSPLEPHGYDVVEYHLQVPREWYEAGRILPLHHNVFSFFPFNVEMHYLLAMHLRGGPWAGMYLAQFMHGAMIALTVPAVCAFARRLRLRRDGAVAAGVAAVPALLFVATTPWMAQLGAIAYDEGGFLLFGTLCVGWILLGLIEPERRVRRFALAGAMAGLACGAKLTAVPELLVAVPLAAALPLLARAESVSRAVGALAAFGAAGLICFCPWLIRTWRWSGNPVFPEMLALGHGDFSPVQVERWHHAHSPRPDQQSIRARLIAGESEILGNWQFGFLLIPTALLSLLIHWRKPDVQFSGAMLFLLALFWLAFTHLQGRFFILAIPICALLIARLPRPAFALALVQAVIGIILLNLRFLTPDLRKLTPEVLGIEDLSWLTPPAAQHLPGDGRIILVGEARAFFYEIPMSQLSYRTVFDADTENRGILAAWLAGIPPGDDWLLIDPSELERFARTYQPFPPVPADIAAHDQTYLVRRSAAEPAPASAPSPSASAADRARR